MAQEVELTLRIASPDPEAVFRDIAALRSIDGYRLSPRGSLAMHDTYFDTPKRDLAGMRYALRLRAMNGLVLLALKGKERETPWGGTARLEIEGPWSVDSIRQIARELGPVIADVRTPDRTDPLQTLGAMGLVVIQSRETARTLFDVSALPGDEPFGELALDRVRYEAGGQGYLHYELEVEAKGGGHEGRLPGFASCLRQAFPGLLEPWEHNKLITGLALEELIRLGELRRDPSGNTPLPLSWYGKMDAWIRRNRGTG